MARQNLENGRTFGEQRQKINDNFIELYADKADLSAVLSKTNTTAFTPSADYHPATKVYADAREAAIIALYDPTGVSADAFDRANHTGTQAPSTIAETTNDRFVSDAQVTSWDGKEDAFSKNTGFNLALGSAAGTVSEGNHTHPGVYEAANANIQTHITDVTTNPHATTAAQVGAEPADAAIQTHINDVFNNPHNVTKVQVGLDFVDNTSDLDKPVSIATQTALDDKVSGTGNLGIGFQPQPDSIHPAHSQGLLFYDATHDALAYYVANSGVTILPGQEFVVRVYNDTGSTILNGTPCHFVDVYTGGTNPVATVEPAQADAFDSALVHGVATENINDGEIGFLTAKGEVHGLDTSSFSTGDVLYLSAANPGEFVTTPPVGIVTVVGAVILSDVSDGVIYVDPLNYLVLPSALAVLDQKAATLDLAALDTYESITGYTTDESIIATANATTGVISVPRVGWYRISVTMTLTLTNAPPASESLTVQIWNNTDSSELTLSTISVPKTESQVSRSFTKLVQFHALDDYLIRIKESYNFGAITFDDISFDIVSVNL